MLINTRVAFFIILLPILIFTAPSSPAIEPLEHHYLLPNFTLQDALQDKTVHQEIWKEKTSIVSFYFSSCPQVCGFLMATMANLHKRYEGDSTVQFVSITTDPKTDTASHLKEYSRKFNARPGRWLFLRGDLAKTVQLVKNGFKLAMSEKNPEFHSEKVALVDDKGWVRGYFTTTSKDELEKLHQAISSLKTEAAAKHDAKKATF